MNPRLIAWTHHGQQRRRCLETEKQITPQLLGFTLSLLWRRVITPLQCVWGRNKRDTKWCLCSLVEGELDCLTRPVWLTCVCHGFLFSSLRRHECRFRQRRLIHHSRCRFSQVKAWKRAFRFNSYNIFSFCFIPFHLWFCVTAMIWSALSDTFRWLVKISRTAEDLPSNPPISWSKLVVAYFLLWWKNTVSIPVVPFFLIVAAHFCRKQAVLYGLSQDRLWLRATLVVQEGHEGASKGRFCNLRTNSGCKFIKTYSSCSSYLINVVSLNKILFSALASSKFFTLFQHFKGEVCSLWFFVGCWSRFSAGLQAKSAAFPPQTGHENQKMDVAHIAEWQRRRLTAVNPPKVTGQRL